MKKINLIKLTLLLFLPFVTHASNLERIGIDDDNYKEMFFKGEIFFDKPFSTGTQSSAFPEFNIENKFSDEFYGAYFEWEHQYDLIPFVKFEMNSYSFINNEDVLVALPSTTNTYAEHNFFSQINSNEVNYTLYYQLLEGNDMQFFGGLKYKILTGDIYYEDTTDGDGLSLSFEKNLPMVYLRAETQFPLGLELSDELSIGIDMEETVFENLIKLTYHTRVGMIFSLGYRYKHQEYIIEDVDMVNSTHGVIVGLGWKY